MFTSMHLRICLAFTEHLLYTVDCSKHWKNREVTKTSPVLHVTYIL